MPLHRFMWWRYYCRDCRVDYQSTVREQAETCGACGGRLTVMEKR